MGELYPFNILFTLGCTMYVLAKQINAIGNPWKRSFLGIGLLFFLALLWHIEGDYIRHYSPEAEARQILEKLVSDWSLENRTEVIKKLDDMASGDQPWIHTFDPRDHPYP